MKERWHTLANAILNGELQSVAYARIYGVKPETARVNCSRLMQNPAFAALLSELREASELSNEAIRTEIVAGHLSDMRNDSLSVADRRAARVALGKICGLELQNTRVKVENDSADDYFMEVLKRCEQAMKDTEEERRERGRRLR